MIKIRFTRREVMRDGALLLGAAALFAPSWVAEGLTGIGPEFVPSYALPPYDPLDPPIPDDALDAADFPDLPAWLDAMASEKKPGKIGPGVYEAGGIGRRRLFTSIYGYGARRPVLKAASAPCILYFSASGVTVQYVRFETPNLALAYVDRGGGLIVTNDWRSADLEGSEREGSRALEYDSDIAGIRILDCEFACSLPIAFMSEYHKISDIHIARNRALPGCFSFAHIRTDRFSGIHVYQNDIRGLSPGRLRGNHVGTVIWVGSSIDNSPNFPRNGAVYIEGNRIEDVTAYGTDNNYNSGVAIDVRESPEAVIRRNMIRNVVNTAGHVDSNAVYAKSNVLLEQNYIENCGAAARGRRSGEAGSEGSLVTFKGNSRCRTTIRNNRFVAGTRTDVPMILVSHEAVIESNTFEGWRYSGNHFHRDAMIRSYSGGPVTIVDPVFIDCGTADGNPHRGYALSGMAYDGGNMVARNFRTSFDGARTDIFHGDIVTENCFNDQGGALTVGYDADAAQIFAAVETELSQSRQAIVDALIRDLKYYGVWQRLRLLNLYHAPDSGMARVDWRAPRRVLEIVGAPRFAPFSGYTATSDREWLDVPYNPVADSLPAGDCMMLIALDGADIRSNHDACGNSAFSLVVRSAEPEDTHAARLATQTHVSLPGKVTSAIGVHAVQRRSAESVEHYKDGAFLGAVRSPMAAHESRPLSVLARAGADETVPYTAWAFAVGQALDKEQHRAFNSALLRFRAAFGA